MRNHEKNCQCDLLDTLPESVFHYCGWENYPTWVLADWLSNDPDRWQTVRSLIQHDPNDSDQQITAVQALRNYVLSMLPCNEQKQNPAQNLFAELVDVALGLIDWYEIIDHLGAEPEKEI